MKKSTKTIVMFASNFSAYGNIQAMKSSLEYLAKEAGIKFVFVNDPERVNNIKVKWGGRITHTQAMQPKELNQNIEAMIA